MRIIAMATVVFVGACGGSKAPAEEPKAETASDATPSDSAAKDSAKSAKAADDGPVEPGVPTKCFKAGDTCTPHPRFVQKLCAGSFPSVALYLFGNQSPWTRGYLTRKTEAYNASGGVSAGGFLDFDEEVLMLMERKAEGGLQVSGAGASYDVLRWDGTCSTLSEGEVTTQKPPSAKSAKVEWRFLDDNVQEALRSDAAVSAAVSTRKQECKGATSGDVSAKCVQADNKLSQMIVSYVRKGGSVPLPVKLP